MTARAIRRCGELLKAIKPAKNQYGAGKGGLTGRGKAARDAGLTLHQQRQATRVANVPADDFEVRVGARRYRPRSVTPDATPRPQRPIEYKSKSLKYWRALLDSNQRPTA